MIGRTNAQQQTGGPEAPLVTVTISGNRLKCYTYQGVEIPDAASVKVPKDTVFLIFAPLYGDEPILLSGDAESVYSGSNNAYIVHGDCVFGRV